MRNSVVRIFVFGIILSAHLAVWPDQVEAGFCSSHQVLKDNETCCSSSEDEKPKGCAIGKDPPGRISGCEGLDDWTTYYCGMPMAFLLSQIDEANKLNLSAPKKLCNEQNNKLKTKRTHNITKETNLAGACQDIANLPKYKRLTENIRTISDNAKKFSENENYGPDKKVVVGDIHGYIYAILEPLLYNRKAEVDLDNPLVFFDIKKNKQVDCNELLKSKNGANYVKDNLILIPNIKPKEVSGKTIFLGDYFDRGEFPAESFYTLVHLHSQQSHLDESKRSIVTLFGNHETDLSQNKKQTKMTGSVNIEYEVGYEKNSPRRKYSDSLNAQILNGNFKQNYFDGNFLYQHTFTTVKFLDDLKKPKSKIQLDANDLTLLNYFTMETRDKVIDFLGRDIQDNEQDIKKYERRLEKKATDKEKIEKKLKKLIKETDEIRNYKKQLEAENKGYSKLSDQENLERVSALSDLFNNKFKENPKNRDQFDDEKGPFKARPSNANLTDLPLARISFVVGHTIVQNAGLQKEESPIFLKYDVTRKEILSHVHFLDTANYKRGTTFHVVDDQNNFHPHKFVKLPPVNGNTQ